MQEKLGTEDGQQGTFADLEVVLSEQSRHSFVAVMVEAGHADLDLGTCWSTASSLKVKSNVNLEAVDPYACLDRLDAFHKDVSVVEVHPLRGCNSKEAQCSHSFEGYFDLEGHLASDHYQALLS